MVGPMLHAVEVEASEETIYEALTTSKGLASFWTPQSEAEPSVGSVAVFGFAGAPVPLKMRVDGLEPGKRVAWSCQGDFPHWAGTTVTWELSPAVQGSGITVLFRHEGWGPDYPEMDFAHVNFVWGQVVARLKAYCETGKSQPFLS
jgi:uncharacterized protein YndB with AHSA1/START domain